MLDFDIFSSMKAELNVILLNKINKIV